MDADKRHHNNRVSNLYFLMVWPSRFNVYLSFIYLEIKFDKINPVEELGHFATSSGVP